MIGHIYCEQVFLACYWEHHFATPLLIFTLDLALSIIFTSSSNSLLLEFLPVAPPTYIMFFSPYTSPAPPSPKPTPLSWLPGYEF
jgi:hypothetical protein